MCIEQLGGMFSVSHISVDCASFLGAGSLCIVQNRLRKDLKAQVDPLTGAPLLAPGIHATKASSLPQVLRYGKLALLGNPPNNNPKWILPHGWAASHPIRFAAELSTAAHHYQPFPLAQN